MDETAETPKKGNSMMMVLGVIVLLVIVGIAVVMIRNRTQTEMVKQEELSETESQEAAENSNTAMTQTDSSTSAATDDSTVKTFTIEAGSFYYKPNAITVKKGDKVKIVMNSVDMMHDFNIDELNVKIPITKSGETNTVEFTAGTVGTFEFYCSVGQHRANGQVGTLIVEE